MFWGLIMKEGKKYSKVVEKDFQLTNAALDLNGVTGDVQVLLGTENVTYLLCTLNKQIPQVHLDKHFEIGEEICFSIKGKGVVHLTGNVIEPDGMDDMDDDDDEGEDEQEELVASNGSRGAKERNAKKVAQVKVAEKIASGEVSSESDEDDATFNGSALDENALNGEDDDEEESDDEPEGDGEDDLESDDDEDDDLESEDDEEEDEDDDEDEDEDVEEEELEPKAKQQKLSADNKAAPQNGNAKATHSKEAPKKQQQQPSATRTLQDGLVVEDLKVGSGPEAKPGKKVALYYVGRLKSNNKVFDSTNQGSGFKFNLGRGDVIRGWDLGVSGMKLGGKRRLTIPPKLAYGAKGSPPVIPPNSTLVFDLELKKVF
ncbi:46 kDa FK506-binding nuclear protein-like [Anopheles bellator]|uniref:46 kDa FK506-binding nuclear protein-like n=1 Tax=Anopheles bellator TaxID=139047 RepID=UPI00264801E0|nr:46 kDa FK506-binding nuclear protein-like [Anopheles bellator]